ncbi:hypothetical protein LguiA_017046 [Lonicera macranthoides]
MVDWRVFVLFCEGNHWLKKSLSEKDGGSQLEDKEERIVSTHLLCIGLDKPDSTCTQWRMQEILLGGTSERVQRQRRRRTIDGGGGWEVARGGSGGVERWWRRSVFDDECIRYIFHVIWVGFIETFQGGLGKKEQRFTAVATVELIRERVSEIGEKLGYKRYACNNLIQQRYVLDKFCGEKFLESSPSHQNE